MERSKALKALAEKIYSGEFCSETADAAFTRDKIGSHLLAKAVGAFHGSLADAEAFIVSALPEWNWEVGKENGRSYGYVGENSGPIYGACEMTCSPARTLLKCALSALAEKEGQP